MAIPDPPPPPPDLIQTSEGNYFVYAYHTYLPAYAYAEHIPTGGAQWFPDLMHGKATARLGMSYRYQCPQILPVPLPALRDWLAPGQPMPSDSLHAPHLLIYADYKAVAPDLGVSVPRLRNWVANGDPERLRKFEQAFRVEGGPPRWYAT